MSSLMEVRDDAFAALILGELTPAEENLFEELDNYIKGEMPQDDRDNLNDRDSQIEEYIKENWDKVRRAKGLGKNLERAITEVRKSAVLAHH